MTVDPSKVRELLQRIDGAQASPRPAWVEGNVKLWERAIEASKASIGEWARAAEEHMGESPFRPKVSEIRGRVLQHRAATREGPPPRCRLCSAEGWRAFAVHVVTDAGVEAIVYTAKCSCALGATRPGLVVEDAADAYRRQVGAHPRRGEPTVVAVFVDPTDEQREGPAALAWRLARAATRPPLASVVSARAILAAQGQDDHGGMRRRFADAEAEREWREGEHVPY